VVTTGGWFSWLQLAKTNPPMVAPLTFKKSRREKFFGLRLWFKLVSFESIQPDNLAVWRFKFPGGSLFIQRYILLGSFPIVFPFFLFHHGNSCNAIF
jgi:hypothetical protein